MKFLQILILSMGINLCFAQLKPGLINPAHVPHVSQHYLPEYTFDQPTDLNAWKSLPHGLNASFATTDELFLRSEVPHGAKQHSATQTAWRGERINLQLLIWSSDTVEQIRVNTENLKSSDGSTIDKSNINPQMVRYVLSNFPYGFPNAACDASASDSAWLMPDRFEKFDRFDLPGNTVRPVWITIDIPQKSKPGTYNGTVTVKSNEQSQTLSLTINVQSMELPKPNEWAFRLDLWQNPWVVASYFNVEPWSAAHKELLKQHLKIYADAGGSYITTYAVHSPWSDNSYSVEGTMIEWLKHTDNSWTFDYTIFDEYVNLAMEMGITKAITIYTPVPWGYRFRYLEVGTGNYIYAEWPPESQEFRNVWKIFLDDLKKHLTEKGWLEKTYLGINENPLDVTIAAVNFIKSHSKEWKITYAGDWHPELAGLLDDYSPIIYKEPNSAELATRKSKGYTTTYYVCCTPAQPNNFVFSPPIEGTFLSWHTAASGYDGFLRWAYDAWPADPLRDARHTFWPAGDCFLVYPGGGSSIRFERLREGIVDFEKIQIIRKKAAASKDKKVKKAMAEFEKHLGTMIIDKDPAKRNLSFSNIQTLVHKGKQMINDLSNQLAE